MSNTHEAGGIFFHNHWAEIHSDGSVTCYGCGRRVNLVWWRTLSLLRLSAFLVLLLLATTAGIIVSHIISRALGVA